MAHVAAHGIEYPCLVYAELVPPSTRVGLVRVRVRVGGGVGVRVRVGVGVGVGVRVRVGVGVGIGVGVKAGMRVRVRLTWPWIHTRPFVTWATPAAFSASMVRR